MLAEGLVSIWLHFVFVTLSSVAPMNVFFTELIISTGFRSTEILPTNGQYYATGRGECAILCGIDETCVAAFFCKSQRLCVTLSNYSQPWKAADNWDALTKGSLFASTPNTVYKRMSGSLFSTSGSPTARRPPYGLAVDANHCQLMCEGASVTCNMFGYSASTRQCMLFDLKTSAASAPTDANLYTYYRYTTVTYTTAAAYSHTMLQNDLTNISWIALSVQTCHNAILTLQPSSSAVISNAYEVLIGGWGNSNACVRRELQGDCYASVHDTFLDCYSPRQFWISWTGGLIRIGTGTVVGENIALTYMDLSPHPVTAVGLSGWAGAPGQWSLYMPLWK